MERKDTYTLAELFNYLPITLVDLSRLSNINEVTLARMRDGRVTRRDTANRLMIALSQVYGRDLSIANVTGLNVMHNKRNEAKEAKRGGDQGQGSPNDETSAA